MSPEGEKSKAMSKRAVLMYTSSLFIIVVVFIVLSYLIDARGDNAVAALSEQNTSALQKIEALRTENERLTEENEALISSVEELEDELRQLYIENEEAENRLKESYQAEYDELLTRHNELLAQLDSTDE